MNVVITFWLSVNFQWNFASDDLQVSQQSCHAWSTHQTPDFTELRNKTKWTFSGNHPGVFLFEDLHLTSKKISSVLNRTPLVFDLKKIPLFPRLQCQNWIKIPLISPWFLTSRCSIWIIPRIFSDRV